MGTSIEVVIGAGNVPEYGLARVNLKHGYLWEFIHVTSTVKVIVMFYVVDPVGVRTLVSLLGLSVRIYLRADFCCFPLRLV